MDEQGWLTCDDPIPMLEFLQAGRGPSSDAPPREGPLANGATRRKLRLFACACVRRTGFFHGPVQLRAIRASELYADGAVDRAALEDAIAPARRPPGPIPSDADFALSVFGPADMAREAGLIDLIAGLGPELDVRSVATKAAGIVGDREGAEHSAAWGRDEGSQQAHLLRDIFGNPFRPVLLDPSCLGEKTRSVARVIYESGRFADLTPLARALRQDAGCADGELRRHCLHPIRHARGCWVVDLVSGRA